MADSSGGTITVDVAVEGLDNLVTEWMSHSAFTSSVRTTPQSFDWVHRGMDINDTLRRDRINPHREYQFPRDGFLLVEREGCDFYVIRGQVEGTAFGVLVSLRQPNAGSFNSIPYIAHNIAMQVNCDDRCILNALEELCYHQGRELRFRCDTQVPIEYSQRLMVRGVPARAWDWGQLTIGFSTAVGDFGNSLNDLAQTMFTEETYRAFGISPDNMPKERAEADARAKQMLVDHLDDKQKEDFGKNGGFICVGKKSRDRYSIVSIRNVNVTRLTKEGKRVSYCLVQKGDVPLYDQLLTQKLLIENNEEMFLEKANNMSERATRMGMSPNFFVSGL